jgi:hypothetical protein
MNYNNILDYKEKILEINKDFIELTNLIDKKSLEVYNKNNSNEKKIDKYKILLDSLIMEHYKISQILLKNN